MINLNAKHNWIQDKSTNVDSYLNKNNVVWNYLVSYYSNDNESKNNTTTTSINTFFEFLDNSTAEVKSKKNDDLDSIMSFVYKMLLSEDFGYGDTPELKYVVENIFRKNKSEAQMAFINMATRKVFTSESDIIEKFFALLMSLEESDIENIALTVVQMFLSHQDISAAEGALSLLDKYGKDKDALDIAQKIRNFDYDFLNDYKEKVINNLTHYVKK